MKRSIVFTALVACVLINTSTAQTITGCNQTTLLQPYPWDKENSINKTPTPYPYIREADVMWAKRIWRTIDLREKINLPYFYPTIPLNDRQSLFDVLKCAIIHGKLTAYANPVMDDEFTTPLTIAEVEKILVSTDSITTEDPYTQKEKQIAISTEVTSKDIKQFWIKEDWYFDKQRSIMDVRIIGICPMMEKKDEQGNVRGNTPLFWIYFSDARPLLAKHETLVRKNNGYRMTYDELFSKRFFSSFIVKESNVYDRSIPEYLTGRDALLEGENIKEGLRNFESDLWQY